MAAQRGVSPSTLVGIDCDWCAYCFDESLVYREWAMVNREITADQVQRELAAHSAATDRMRRELHG